MCVGPTEELHLYKDLLHTLVEEGELLAAKIARKDPKTDPFPHKPCGLYVYTSGDRTEIEQVRTRLIDIGLTPSQWKSEIDTRIDWEADGKLYQEAEIVKAKKQLQIASSQSDRPRLATPKHVFISHASHDDYVATAIVDYLERHSVTCWYATRDILPGTNYDEAIVEAIEQTLIVAVLVSDASNASGHVKRELEIATNAGATLLPILIGTASVGRKLKYFLAGTQLLTIHPPFDDAQLDLIAQSAKGLLSQ